MFSLHVCKCVCIHVCIAHRLGGASHPLEFEFYKAVSQHVLCRGSTTDTLNIRVKGAAANGILGHNC